MNFNIENFHHAINFNYSQARIGYATETVRALLKFGFTQLALHRIYAPVTPANVASARVLKKVGMRREGHFKKSLQMQNKWVDVWLYAILQEEWQTQP